MSETMQDEQPVVMEDTEEDRARMAALDAAIAEHGMQGGEPDEGTRGLGSPQTMIAEAKKHLGYRESGTNDAKFNHWLGAIRGASPPFPHDGFGYPWCHCFVSYCLAHSDNAGAGPRTASCNAGHTWFEQRGRFSRQPHVGDFVYYGDGGNTHVELVIGVGANSITTIGGNTSGGAALGARLFNGDGVYTKTVDLKSPKTKIFGYGSPEYATGAADVKGGGRSSGSSVKGLTNVRSIRKQQEAVNSLGRTPPLDVDGEWGPNTEKGVKWLQKRVGCAEADGQWGQETERLFKAFS